MPRVHKTSAWMLGFASLVLLGLPATAAAQSEEDSVRLSGAVRFVSDLPSIELTTPDLGGDAQTVTLTGLTSFTPAPSVSHEADSRGTASALAWYERFTVAPSDSLAVWGAQQREFQLQGGNRWGVTIGYIESERQPMNLGLDDIQLGSFYQINERLRLGGQIRFTSPEEEVFGEDTEEKKPELRFESAFRF